MNETQTAMVSTPFLMMVGAALKRSPWFPDPWIPVVLTILGSLATGAINGFSIAGFVEGLTAGASAVGFHQIFIQSQTNKPQPPTTPPVGLFLVLAFTSLFAVGCASFSTTQTDLSYEDGKPQRQITTRASASTFFTSKSQLANFKATQTDKTQGASVGSLTQEASGTNAVRALELMSEIMKSVK